MDLASHNASRNLLADGPLIDIGRMLQPSERAVSRHQGTKEIEPCPPAPTASWQPQRLSGCQQLDLNARLSDLNDGRSEESPPRIRYGSIT
jgi:hypothetical protein